MSNLPTATQAGADAKPRSLISLNVGPTAWLAVRAGTLGAAFALATSIPHGYIQEKAAILASGKSAPLKAQNVFRHVSSYVKTATPYLAGGMVVYHLARSFVDDAVKSSQSLSSWAVGTALVSAPLLMGVITKKPFAMQPFHLALPCYAIVDGIVGQKKRDAENVMKGLRFQGR